jgi:hypothetical protein
MSIKQLLAACAALAIANPVHAQVIQFIDQFGNPVAVSTTNPLPIGQASCNPYHLSNGSAASTNSTNIVNRTAVLCDLTLINPTSTLGYLKVYDLATAPVCSSTTNLKHVFPVPENSGNGSGVVRVTLSEYYANGISYCFVGGGLDNDNSNAPAGVAIEGSWR